MQHKQENPAALASANGAETAQLGGKSGTENGPDADDAQVIIGEFAKNKRERLRVSLKKYKGIDLLDARVFFPADDGSWRGTAKGISIKPTLLPELIRLLRMAEAEARRRGLLT